MNDQRLINCARIRLLQAPRTLFMDYSYNKVKFTVAVYILLMRSTSTVPWVLANNVQDTSIYNGVYRTYLEQVSMQVIQQFKCYTNGNCT